MTSRRIDPWGTFEMDDSTGLPKAPEGMFFRVRNTKGEHWYVDLRKKMWFGSYKVQHAIARHSHRPITRKNIIDSAAYALTLYSERNSTESDLTLLGDYPPKKA